MKFAVVAAVAVASAHEHHHDHHPFGHLFHKMQEFHHKHPHPIREFFENKIEEVAGPTKKELLEKLHAVKKQIVMHESKLKWEEEFVKKDDVMIKETEAKLKKEIAAKAPKKEIEATEKALKMEKEKEAYVVKDEAVEKKLIKEEMVEAKKLWEEIKNLPGSVEIGDTPSKKELLKKLWAVKKQMYQDEMKLKAEMKMVKYEDQAIIMTEAKLKALVEKKAPKAEIAAVTEALKVEKTKEAELKKDEVVEQGKIKSEAAEAKKLWAEIKKLPSKREEQYKMDVIKLEQIVDGILRGALDAENLTDISTCITDMDKVFSQTEQAVKDFSAGGASNILAGLKEIGGVLQTVDVDMKDCSKAKEDWPRLEALAKVFESPKEFAYHVGKDIMVNGKDIFHEIEASITDYKAEQWEQFGLDVGTAAAKTILGDDEEPEDDIEEEQEDLFLY
jgi:hypothetical protein